ncbi:MAG: hypothetical protein ABFS17_00430 [Chloroflexota bacterium]
MVIFAGVIVLASKSIGDGSYESSLYSAYPPLFWAGIISVLVLGLVQILLVVFQRPNSYRWWLGLLLIVMVNLFIISLPYFRDYMFNGQWDSPNHHSMILTIRQTGHSFKEDFYPFSHLITAVFSIISGQSVPNSMHFTTIFFYLIGVMNVFFLAWVYDSRPGVRGILLALSSLLIYSNYQSMYFPVQYSIYMLLYFLAWFLKTRQTDRTWKEVIIFILVLLFLPYLHPLAVVSPLVFLLIYLIPLIKSGQREQKSFFSKINRVLQPIYPGFLTLLASWFLWFSTFRAFGKTIIHLVSVIRDGILGFNSLESFVSASERASLEISKILSLIVFTYGSGGGIVLIALICVAVYLIGRNWKWNQLRSDLVVFPVFMIFFLSLAVSSLFRDIITSNPIRYLNFAVFLAPLIIGPLIFEIMDEKNSIKKNIRTLIFVIFSTATIAVGIIGVFNVSFSSIIGQPNNQYTYARAAGAEYFLEYASDEPGNIYSISARERIFRGLMPIGEIAALLQGNESWRVKVPPPHFGYSEANGEGFEDPEYLFLTGYGAAYYSELWTTGGLFTPEDFELLDNDPSWNRVYQSGDFTLWAWRDND